MVLVIVLCLLGMALFLGLLIESLRADQLTLSFRIAELPVGDFEIVHNHGRLVRDSTVVVALGAAAAVLWLVWQYQAHANLRAMVPGLQFRPVPAVAAWFIPGANLILPMLALRELWRASDPGGGDWRKAWTTPVLWLWWLLSLSALALAAWALAPAFHAHPTLEQLYVRDHRAVIAAGVGLLTAVASAILMVILDARVTLREGQAWGWKGWSDR
jgi:hypothetical protein